MLTEQHSDTYGRKVDRYFAELHKHLLNYANMRLLWAEKWRRIVYKQAASHTHLNLRVKDINEIDNLY